MVPYPLLAPVVGAAGVVVPPVTPRVSVGVSFQLSPGGVVLVDMEVADGVGSLVANLVALVAGASAGAGVGAGDFYPVLCTDFEIVCNYHLGVSTLQTGDTNLVGCREAQRNREALSLTGEECTVSVP